MKKILLFAAMTALVSACSENEVYLTEQSSNEISILPLLSSVVPVAAPETRVGYTGTTAAWGDGDAIGLFCTPINANNIQFTVADAATSPAWSTMSPIYWQDATTFHKFLAYYPYVSENTNSAAVKVPALNAQTGTPLSPTLDLMVSNNQNTLGVLRPAGAVPLIFTHVFALIELDIKLGSGFAANTTLGSFTFTAGVADKVFTSDATSTIALATKTMTIGATTNTQTITPATSPVLSTSTATPVYAYILPGTYLASNITITIKDGGTTTYTTASLPLATLIFATATKYSYAVTISRSSITISNPTITDWIPVVGTPLTPTI